MPAVVISVPAVHIDNAILLDYLTSEVALGNQRLDALTETSGWTTVALMTNSNLRCHRAEGITTMTVSSGQGQCYPNHQPATMGCDGTQEVSPGNRRCSLI
jgi:hypothetical protein